MSEMGQGVESSSPARNLSLKMFLSLAQIHKGRLGDQANVTHTAR